MKIFKLLVVFFVFILALIIFTLSLYIRYYGREILQEALYHSLKKEVFIETLNYQPPLGLKAENIHVKGLLKAKEVDMHFRLDSIINERKFNIESITFIQPLMVHKNDIPPSKKETLPPPLTNQSEDASTKKISIEIKKLFIEDGQLEYANINEETGKSLSFTLSNIYLTAEDLQLPLTAEPVDFKGSARLRGTQKSLDGSIMEFSGWMNFPKKDTDTKLNIKNEKGQAELSAELISKDNNMVVSGTTHLEGIKLISSQNNAMQNALLGSLSSGLEVNANFSFNTKMDDIKIKEVSFSGDVQAPEIK